MNINFCQFLIILKWIFRSKSLEDYFVKANIIFFFIFLYMSHYSVAIPERFHIMTVKSYYNICEAFCPFLILCCVYDLNL